MNWNDPTERARLIERIGPTEYNRQLRQHHDESVLEIVAGHAIRPAHSFRFGKLFLVGGTGVAFGTMELARAYATEHPKEAS